MPRRKIKLAFIQNHADRKASFRKRKMGLIKKVEEISILCDIDACIIIYGPFDDEPEFWPPSSSAIIHLLSKFKGFPETERIRRMVNQEGFTNQRVKKMQDQLIKQQKRNREKELTHFIDQCLAGEQLTNFSLLDLNDIGWQINRSLNEISWRMAFLKKHVPQSPPMIMPLGDNISPMVAPEIPANEIQGITMDMDMLRISEPPSFSGLWWDEFLLPPSFNNDGAGPSHSIP